MRRNQVIIITVTEKQVKVVSTVGTIHQHDILWHTAILQARWYTEVCFNCSLFKHRFVWTGYEPGELQFRGRCPSSEESSCWRRRWSSENISVRARQYVVFNVFNLVVNMLVYSWQSSSNYRLEGVLRLIRLNIYMKWPTSTGSMYLHLSTSVYPYLLVASQKLHSSSATET